MIYPAGLEAEEGMFGLEVKEGMFGLEGHIHSAKMQNDAGRQGDELPQFNIKEKKL